MKWNSIFSGRLEIALTSADIHSALQNIVEIGVEARDITFVNPLHIRFTISRKSYGPLLALCRKRGDSIQILRHLGMRHIISGMRKRPILIAGMLFICILSVWLPTRVFFVRVEGNVCVPTRYILEQAAQCGVQFGASCRRIRSDPVKNALLAAIPQLQWAGVNTYLRLHGSHQCPGGQCTKGSKRSSYHHEHCRSSGRCGPEDDRTGGQSPMHAGRCGDPGAGFGFSLHGLWYLHSGNRHKSRDLWRYSAAADPHLPHTIPAKNGNNRTKEKIFSDNWKKTHKFLQREWNFGYHLC